MHNDKHCNCHSFNKVPGMVIYEVENRMEDVEPPGHVNVTISQTNDWEGFLKKIRGFWVKSLE